MDGSHRLKLQRALEHLEALEAAVHLWAATDPCFISYECEVNTRQHTLTQRVLRQPTAPIFAALIGDAAHNMRQGLDHLAYQLAIRVYRSDPPRNAETSMWPIRSKAKLQGAIANDIGPKKHMPPGMYAAIEGFQSDAGSDGLLLGALNLLDNRDKHRLPPLVAGIAGSVEIERLHASGGVEIGGGLIRAQTVVIGGLLQLGAFDDGEIIVRAGSEILMEDGSEMDVNVRPTPSIAFGRSYDVAPGELVLPVLVAIHDAIVQRLFPALEQFL